MRGAVRRFFILVCLAILAGPELAYAQSDHPDWFGYYALARNGIGSLKPVAADLDAEIINHLQPWAKAKMEMTDGTADDTGAVCLPDGIFRNPPFAGRFTWMPASDHIVQVFWEINTAGVRRIYLNRDHPMNVPLTWNGDSVGQWEGDTLVVDTIGFNDKSWLMSGMEPHTSEAHMVERIRLVHEGDVSGIEIKTVIEDRHALTSAYSYTRYYRKGPIEAMNENVCADDIEVWKQWRNEHLERQYTRAKQVK
jgi:hypothetical protein